MIEFINYQMLQSSTAFVGKSMAYHPSYAPVRAREFFDAHLAVTKQNMQRMYPALYPALYPDDYTQPLHAARHEYFDRLHADEYVRANFISAKPRSTLKPGQVAMVNISAQRGHTTIPSGTTFWVQLMRPAAQFEDGAYWYVRVLYNARGSAYAGRVFIVSRGSLNRVDLDDDAAALTRDFNTRCKPNLTQRWAVTFRTNYMAYLRTKYEYPSGGKAHPVKVLSHKTGDVCRAHENDAYYGGCRLATNVLTTTRNQWRKGQIARFAMTYLTNAAAANGGVPAPEAITELFSALLPEVAGVRYGVSCGSKMYSDAIYRVTARLRSEWSLMNTHPDIYESASCQHWATEHHVVYTRSFCPACLAEKLKTGEVVYALNRGGQSVPWFANNAYTHEDGLHYTYAPPPLIGAYHSSKNVHTKPLPLLTGKPIPADTLKLGYELEFDRHGKGVKNEEVLVQELRARLRPVFEAVAPQKYATWERDSSVWFEMVSGYGDISVHREALKLLLDTDQFRTELKSHDGGRCGLHVHLDCPKTLSHALKLTAFYNAACNELLLSTVARRYAGSTFAVVSQNRFKNKCDWRYSAERMARLRRYDGYSRGEALESALQNLANSRYDAVNWENAPKSVEIRIFRGTMIAESAIACLEFAYLSWYFTRDTPDDKLTTQEFLSFISQPKWRGDSKYLRAYLAKRGFKGVFLANSKPLDEGEEVLATEIPDESDTEYVRKYNHRVQQRRARMAMVQAA